jgi:hypothetical protein
VVSRAVGDGAAPPGVTHRRDHQPTCIVRWYANHPIGATARRNNGSARTQNPSTTMPLMSFVGSSNHLDSNKNKHHSRSATIPIHTRSASAIAKTRHANPPWPCVFICSTGPGLDSQSRRPPRNSSRPMPILCGGPYSTSTPNLMRVSDQLRGTCRGAQTYTVLPFHLLRQSAHPPSSRPPTERLDGAAQVGARDHARCAGRADIDGLAKTERVVPPMRPSCALQDHGCRTARAMPAAG